MEFNIQLDKQASALSTMSTKTLDGRISFRRMVFVCTDYCNTTGHIPVSFHIHIYTSVNTVYLTYYDFIFIIQHISDQVNALSNPQLFILCILSYYSYCSVLNSFHTV